jgi:ribulose-5-phosphate 4-epimerase/fuculose-1-phosphate aldolase
LPFTDFPPEALEGILDAARTANRFGLMAANQGNFSVRDPESGLIAVTPHDRPYEQMTAADLVIVDPEGRTVLGEHIPTYDLAVHRTVYRRRPDVHAVIHTEPPFVNAFGAVGIDIDAVTTTGLKSANGSVPIMPFSAVRDERFAEEMLTLMGARHAVVWGSHGLLVVGPTIQQALDRSLGIEFNAKVLVIARSLGTPLSLAYLDAAMVVA